MISSGEVSAADGTRARIVLWRAEGRLKKDIAALAGVSRPTVMRLRGSPQPRSTDEIRVCTAGRVSTAFLISP